MRTPKTYLTIEQNARGATYRDADGSFTLYLHRPYERSSVLHGRMARIWLGKFDTEAEARAEAKREHPGVKIESSGGSSYERFVPLPSTPPAWFDPMDAGETW